MKHLQMGSLAFPAVYGSTNREYVDFGRLLESLADFIENALPDDILAYVRFDDDGERLTLVQQLASAQEDAENASDFGGRGEGAARRALVLAKAAAQKVAMGRSHQIRCERRLAMLARARSWRSALG